MSRIRSFTLTGIVIAASVMVACVAAPALAAPATVAWELNPFATPTYFQLADNGVAENPDKYVINLTNVGDAQSTGMITIQVTLPEGVRTSGPAHTYSPGAWSCTPEAAGAAQVTCTSETPVPALATAFPATERAITMPVEVVPGAPGPAEAEVTVSGGTEACATPGSAGCPSASARVPSAIGAPAPPFGAEDFTAGLLGGDGTPDTQAGAHPDAIVNAFVFPSATLQTGSGGFPTAAPVQNIDQTVVELPPGVVGDALAAPTCSIAAVQAIEREPNGVRTPARSARSPCGKSHRRASPTR